MSASGAGRAAGRRVSIPHSASARRGSAQSSAPGGSTGPTSTRWVVRRLTGLRRLDSPVTSYYVLFGSAVLLLGIGLVMVLSASVVTSLKTSGSPLTIFRNQALFAAIGFPLMIAASRVPVRWWPTIGWVALPVALLAQLLVFSPLGVEVNGNRNWIDVGGQRMQPSEMLKLALILWGAAVLSRKVALVRQWSHACIPVLFPVGALGLGLVLAGHDLGTGLVVLLILGGLMFAAGVPMRMFAMAAAAAAVVVGLLIMQSENRMRRITGWLSGESCADPLNTCYQSVHGKYALADGGWWGVGLGASREKWSWLPEAHNDFIFAIIGEELGLPGALVVLGLFLALGWACLRLVTRTEDPFVRIVSAAAMAWLVGQMFINVGAVIGILPVIGVPLPLVSSGGSALVTSLIVLGVLMSLARAEPGAARALGSRPSVVRRSLAVFPGLTKLHPGRRAR
ncbi:MAG: putative lipid II flippase FtsW [Actinomycetota bacterium]